MAAVEPRVASPATASEEVGPPPISAKQGRWRWLTVVIAVAVIASVMAVLIYEEVPPASPFHEDWSRSLPGNPLSMGAHEGSTFVTYAATASPTNPPFENVSFRAMAIDANNGQTLWTSQPIAISNIALFEVEVDLSGPLAYLLCSVGAPPVSGLEVLALNLTTGSAVGSWNVSVGGSLGGLALPPSEFVTMANSTLVVSYPDLYNGTFVVRGLDALTGAEIWTTWLPLPPTSGWGTGDEETFAWGPAVFFVLATVPEELVALNAANGELQYQRSYTGPSGFVNGVAVGPSFYYLSNTSGTLAVDGVNLSTGTESSSFPVPEAVGASLQNGVLYSVGSLLMVASSASSIRYAAFFTNGTEAWSVELPLACSPGSFGCAPGASQPMPYGGGSEVLVSSFSYFLLENATYLNTYLLVNLTGGTVRWSASYTFNYGASTWFGPVPDYLVGSVVGFEVIYSILAPGEATTAGGTLV